MRMCAISFAFLLSQSECGAQRGGGHCVVCRKSGEPGSPTILVGPRWLNRSLVFSTLVGLILLLFPCNSTARAHSLTVCSAKIFISPKLLHFPNDARWQRQLIFTALIYDLTLQARIGHWRVNIHMKSMRFKRCREWRPAKNTSCS